jgi:polyisoprenoid-binding protein YceI
MTVPEGEPTMTYLPRRPSFLSAAFVLTCALAANAALTSVGESTSGFRAVGPGGLKIDGTGKGVKASEAGGILTIVAPVNDLKTGMSLRDDHLKKAIHTDKHPTATLAVPRASLQFPEDGKSVTGSTTGKFTLNGVTKDLKFEYKVTRTGSDYHVQGKAQIDITAFKIEKPCYLGVCVEKDVQIKVQLKLRE